MSFIPEIYKKPSDSTLCLNIPKNVGLTQRSSKAIETCESPAECVKLCSDHTSKYFICSVLRFFQQVLYCYCQENADIYFM